MTGRYIRDLVAAYPAVKEVWLYGSRANGYADPDSDWDYLAFADDDTLSARDPRATNHYGSALTSSSRVSPRIALS
jgi:predicted nucleotidyltransferase